MCLFVVADRFDRHPQSPSDLLEREHAALEQTADLPPLLRPPPRKRVE
jgi:hypothetical protein